MFNHAPLRKLHKDHTEYLTKAQKYQLKVYSCKSVADKYNNVNILEIGRKYRMGSFYIQAVSVPHGDCECYAYIIDHEDMGRMLFATDLSDFPYTIRNCNHILLECNYSLDAIIENAMEGSWNNSASKTHLSIDKCFEILHRLDNENLMNIVLLHPSDKNSDERRMCKCLQDEFPLIAGYVADKGLVVELSKNDF